MKFCFQIVFLALCLPSIILAAPAPKISSQEVAKQLQKRYKNTKSYSADFVQNYKSTLFRRQESSLGSIQYKRPGLMRWDYKSPQKKMFLLNGKTLWLYEPANKQAFINRCFQQDTLSASMAFLWGDGEITRFFIVDWAKPGYGNPKNHNLVLKPKETQQLIKEMILSVDPKTFTVEQSIVIDSQGNENQFIFSKPVFNKALPNASFDFSPPTGVHVMNIPGNCNEVGPTKK